jgi:NTE family protein
MRGLYEIVQQDKSLFEIITGTSAGAINAVYLAANSTDWDVATGQLWDLWAGLKPQDIFDLGALSIGKLGSKWLTGATFGGLAPKGSGVNHLLDTAPLRQLLKREIDFDSLNKLIQDGELQGFGVSTTNYYSGSSVVFHNTAEPIEDWARTDRFSVRTDITLEHIMASSAIPLFFPPESIGESWYGDGCLRQSTPLSPAIHLGADKIISIGIRAPHPVERQQERAFTANRNPSIGQIAGVLMNAVFLDAMESDVERLSRVNQTLYHLDKQKKEDYFSNLRPIPILMLRPSQDLGAMTAQLGKKLPPMLHYLLKGIGVTGNEGLDLLSYLAFDKSYSLPLMDLGRQDTLARSEEIKRFLAF